LQVNYIDIELNKYVNINGKKGNIRHENHFHVNEST